MTALIKDTFTDTAGTLLRNHSPDLGGAWQSPYELRYGFYDPDEKIVAGGGVAPIGYVDTIDSMWLNVSTVPVADYSVSMDFVINVASSGYLLIDVIAHSTDLVTGNFIKGHFYVPVGGPGSVGYGTTTINAQIAIGGYGPLQEGNVGINSFLPTAAQTALGTHTIKLTVAGNVYTLFYDGSQVNQRTITALPAAGYAGHAIYMGGGASAGDVTMKNFLVDGVAALPQFWQSRVNTNEVQA